MIVSRGIVAVPGVVVVVGRHVDRRAQGMRCCLLSPELPADLKRDTIGGKGVEGIYGSCRIDRALYGAKVDNRPCGAVVNTRPAVRLGREPHGTPGGTNDRNLGHVRGEIQYRKAIPVGFHPNIEEINYKKERKKADRKIDGRKILMRAV